MRKSICGIDCDACELRANCGGCAETGGRPFGGDCLVARCDHAQERPSCGACCESRCRLRDELIAEFNALGIEDMEEVTGLNALWGAFVNVEYTLPSGQKIKFWDDDRIYLGNQICKKGSDRCYGLTADENTLLVCEYGAEGSDPEIVVYKRRKK